MLAVVKRMSTDDRIANADVICCYVLKKVFADVNIQVSDSWSFLIDP